MTARANTDTRMHERGSPPDVARNMPLHSFTRRALFADRAAGALRAQEGEKDVGNRLGLGGGRPRAMRFQENCHCGRLKPQGTKQE